MFSVLMAIYRKDDVEFLRQSIESIVNQTLAPSQIVIVKDGELTQELEKMLSNYTSDSRFKFVQLENNIGQAMALNRGISECDHELIARMDSDDICYETRFEKQFNIFKDNPQYDVVGTGILEFSENIEDGDSLRTLPEEHDDIISYSKYRSPVNHATVMYRKSKVLGVGNYHNFLWNDDYHLWARMIHQNAHFYNIQEPLLYVRGGEAMFHRRGGFKYAVQDYKLQKYFLGLGHINIIQFIVNLCLRVPVRLVPNSIRGIIYKSILRQKTS